MKITKEQLKDLIKEELNSFLDKASEAPAGASSKPSGPVVTALRAGLVKGALEKVQDALAATGAPGDASRREEVALLLQVLGIEGVDVAPMVSKMKKANAAAAASEEAVGTVAPDSEEIA